MTLPEPTDVIAPREDLPYEPITFLAELLEGSYPYGVVLEYHGLKLESHVDDERTSKVVQVYTADDVLIEVLNMDAFRTASELQDLLDEIVAYDPADREAWRNR